VRASLRMLRARTDRSTGRRYRKCGGDCDAQMTVRSQCFGGCCRLGVDAVEENDWRRLLDPLPCENPGSCRLRPVPDHPDGQILKCPVSSGADVYGCRSA